MFVVTTEERREGDLMFVVTLQKKWREGDLMFVVTLQKK